MCCLSIHTHPTIPKVMNQLSTASVVSAVVHSRTADMSKCNNTETINVQVLHKLTHSANFALTECHLVYYWCIKNDDDFTHEKLNHIKAWNPTHSISKHSRRPCVWTCPAVGRDFWSISNSRPTTSSHLPVTNISLGRNQTLVDWTDSITLTRFHYTDSSQ